MHLKRHYVLYAFIALSLIISLLLFITPRSSKMSYSSPETLSHISAVSTSTLSGMRFEVVTTEADQEKGLGGRNDVPENYGMLFVFAQKSSYGFWMKDMLTPIDIVWLSDTGTILGIVDSIAPSTYSVPHPEIVRPPQPVKYVLETRAGESRRRGWSIGTDVGLPLPYGK